MTIRQIQRSTSAFQQPIDEQELQYQLARHLKGEVIQSVIELNAGLFNNTYRVTTSQRVYILKIAPHSQADVFYNERLLMQREQTLAHHLQSVSSLIPKYLSFFPVGDRAAFLQTFIPGRLWHDVEQELSADENAKLWEQLGLFAKTIHSTRGDTFGYPEPHKHTATWSEFIVDNVEGMIADCRRLHVMHEEVHVYLDLLPHFIPMLDEVRSARLLHGDLWPRNVIINGDGDDIHISAVIDGERAFWGDPLCDWVLILYGVPTAFWTGYGEDISQTGHQGRIAVYKGMYFILNILEATRFDESDKQPRQWLAGINAELNRYL